MEYMILPSTTTSDLEHDVRTFIAEGWVPLGGVAVSVWSFEGRNGRENGVEYLQAMTRSK
jgi:hypothetical protein